MLAKRMSDLGLLEKGLLLLPENEMDLEMLQHLEVKCAAGKGRRAVVELMDDKNMRHG